MAIKVVATRRGFYKSMREKGSVFEVESEKELGSWMKPADDTGSGKSDEEAAQPRKSSRKKSD